MKAGCLYGNVSARITPAPTTTPEPNSLALMLIGLIVFSLIAARPARSPHLYGDATRRLIAAERTRRERLVYSLDM